MLTLRLSAAILLLILTFTLTKLSPSQQSSGGYANSRRSNFNKIDEIWSHASSCHSNMTSNIHYFSTYPELSILSYQHANGNAHTNEKDMFFTGFGGDAQGGMDFVQFDDDTIQDHHISGKELMYTGECEGKDCILRVSKNNCELEKFLWLYNKTEPLTTSCYTGAIVDGSDGKLVKKVDFPFLGTDSIILSALASEGEWIYYISGGGTSWSLHRLSVSTGEDESVLIPNVNAQEVQKMSLISTFNNRLGTPGTVTDIPIYKPQSNKSVELETTAATPPILLYVAKDFLAVIRASSGVGVIAQIVAKQNLRLTKSVQFDNMDSAWVIQAPNSYNPNYLIIMGKNTSPFIPHSLTGAAPPYSWQTEAIDLATGSVETKHSFI